MPSIMSPPVLRMVPPLSFASTTAISWARDSSPLAIWFRIFDRSAWLMRGQGPSSKAFRAARMARSVSARSARATRAHGSSVAGLIDSSDFPLWESPNWPSM